MGEPTAKPVATWSTFANQYTVPSGRTLLQTLLVACMEQHFFPRLDSIVAEAHKKQQTLRILILAGGPGPEVPLLVDRYGRDVLRIVLTDLSPSMVEEAKATVIKNGLEDIVETRVMDATQIDVPAATFDVVFMCYGIASIPEDKYETCFDQIGRALKTDGVFFLSTPGEDNVMLQLFDEGKQAWMKEYYTDDDIAKNSVAIESEKRLAFVRDMPWRNPDILLKRLQTCSTLKDNINVAIVPAKWTTEDEINELFEAFYNHPQNHRLFLFGFPSEEEGKKFFENVRQRAVAVAKKDGGLRAASNCLWARNLAESA